MRIVIHTLATDTDCGTEAYVFTNEEDAYRHVYEATVVTSHWAEEPKPTFEEFMEDPCERMEPFKDPIDTYSVDYAVLDIPIRKIIRDSIRLHPITQEVVRRGRAALRLAREVFGRSDHSHSA